MPDVDAAPGRRRYAPTTLDVQGHRGATGLAPESTTSSFEAAFACGVTGIEFDVRLTGDGHVVVWHDPTLEAEKCLFTGADLTDARVDELTLEQLRTVDVGSRTLAEFPAQRPQPGARILTLVELIERFAATRPDVWWTVEVKVDPTDPREVATRRELTEKVVALINGGGLADRAFVHSFDWAVLELAAELDPSLLRSATVDAETYAPGSPWLGSIPYAAWGPDVAGAARALGADCLSLDHAMLTPEIVERAHELGLAVLPWTVNEVADLRRVIDCGVDGLITDYPDRLPLP